MGLLKLVPWFFPTQMSAEAVESAVFLQGVDSAVLARGDGSTVTQWPSMVRLLPFWVSDPSPPSQDDNADLLSWSRPWGSK